MFDFLKPKPPDCGYFLEYLFIAELFNGQLIKQTPDDKAKFSSWGSAFTDVCNVMDQVKKFSLHGKGTLLTIDLTDGHAEIDGHFLYPPFEILPCTKFKLIYYRTISRSMRMGVDGKILPPGVKYVVGWESPTPKGKNGKWELALE